MLAAKFVFGKTFVTEPRPHQPFAPGFARPQAAGEARGFGSLFQHGNSSEFYDSPSPRPSPAGRGRIVSVALKSQRLDSREPFADSRDRPIAIPSPPRRGRSEERRVGKECRSRW